jgi:hypothetical protein
MSAVDIINDPTVRGWLIVGGSVVGSFVGQVVQLRFIRKVVRAELVPATKKAAELDRRVALLEKGKRWLVSCLRGLREARHHG